MQASCLLYFIGSLLEYPVSPAHYIFESHTSGKVDPVVVVRKPEHQRGGD